MATAGMRHASSTSPSPSPTTATTANDDETFNWEAALERDLRLPQMSKYMEQILRANFPAISEKLRREEPPARRYEPHAPPPPPPQMPQTQPMQKQSRPAAAKTTAAKTTAVNGNRDNTARATVPNQPRPQPPRRPTHPHASELTLTCSSGDSSSELDMREVDPMDELSDFETQPPPALPAQAPAAHDSSKRWETRGDDDNDADGDDEMNGGDDDTADVAMDVDPMDMDDNDTTCTVCRTTENEDKILLCDGCNAEYHLYCLTPPLTSVPLDEDWFCPRCAPTRPAATTSSSNSAPAVATASTGDVDSSVASSAAATSQQQQQQSSKPPAAASNDQSAGSRPAPPTKHDPTQPPPPAITIAQTFESDAVRSNELLVHACQCEELKCADSAFHEFCAPMKRFLRSACWASHSDKWRSYRIARATAELFAFHAMQCREPHCSVPMCDELRAEEVV